MIRMLTCTPRLFTFCITGGSMPSCAVASRPRLGPVIQARMPASAP